MTKKIKFRAWMIKNGERRMTYTLDKVAYFNDSELCIHGGIRDDGIELMQYTGFKDKNGKEIYEGDLILVPGYSSHNIHNQIGIVGWMDEGWVIVNKKNKFIGLLWRCFNIDNGKVIGNKFENPELLKTNKQI